MLIMGFDKADFRSVVNLWRMSLADRYLGSALGTAWALLNPLLMFAVYTFVFGYVFKTRLPGVDSTLAYSIWLICGYGPWLANTEALTASSYSIISNTGLVKNMSFKTELLPIAATLLGLVPLFVSIVFLLGLQLFAGDGWRWSMVWLPLVVLIQFLFLSAFGIIIAAITTFVRDAGIILPNLLMILLFATPIFYPIESLPLVAQHLMTVNPIYIIASAYRSSLIGPQPIPLVPLLMVAVISLGCLSLALAGFRRVKMYFSTVV